jgi:glycine betaine catabolism B
MVHDLVPDARERETYLSGLPSLVPQLKRELRRSGVRRVRTDAFIGY